MAELLRRRRLKDMNCTVHDMEVMGSNPGRVELGVYGTSVYVTLEPEILAGLPQIWCLYRYKNSDTGKLKLRSK